MLNYIGQDLLRDTLTPGSALTDSIGTQTQPGLLVQKFVIPMIECKHEIKNQTNTLVHVSVYDIVLRETQAITPDPLGDILTGLAMERTGASSTRTSVNALGVTPFQSSLFCKRWKVIRSTTLAIPAGSTHIHTTMNRPRKMFSFDDDTSLTISGNTHGGAGSQKAYQGYTTMASMVRIWGGTVDQSDAQSNVYTGQAAVDVVTRCYVKYAQFVKNKRVHAIFNTQTPGGTASTMLDDTDAQATVTVA